MKIFEYFINLNSETIFHKFSFKATTSEATKFSSLLELMETPTFAK